MKKRLLPLLKHPSTAKVALGLYVFCVVALIGTYMGVSNRDVRRAAFFQTSEFLESGRSNAMRGAFLDAQTGQFLAVREVRVELFKGDDVVPGTGRLLGTGSVGAAGILHLNLEPPADLPEGEYSLGISAVYPDGERFAATGQVVLGHAGEQAKPDWPTISLRDEPRKHPRAVVTPEKESDDHPRVAVAVYPPDGELVRGLTNVVFLRTTDPKTGAPLPSRVRLEKTQGVFDGELPGVVTTNRLGLARIEWVPITDTNWTLKVSALGAEAPDEGQEVEEEEISVRWHTVPAQFSINLPEPIARPGQNLQARVESLFQSGGFFIDLYDDARWLDGAAFGLSEQGGGLQIGIPASMTPPAFYRIQVYQNFYSPSRAWDTAYVARVDESSTQGLRDAAGRLVSFLADNEDDAYYRYLMEGATLELMGTSEVGPALEAYLLAIPRRFEPPMILINTQQADRDALEAWKEKVKADLMVLTFLIFFAGMVAIVYFVFLGVMRQRREALLIQEVDLETDAMDDEASYLLHQRAIRIERIVVVLQAGIVLTTVLAFALGILMLLSYL
ncbi:MAG: hypothetical protein ACNA8W_09165 [Bradymonadaceae bacterium]